MKAATLEDQVVIATGASSGIGNALALQLANEGAAIVLAAWNAERLEKGADEWRALGGQALIEETVRAFGRIKVL